MTPGPPTAPCAPTHASPRPTSPQTSFVNALGGRPGPTKKRIKSPASALARTTGSIGVIVAKSHLGNPFPTPSVNTFVACDS